LVLGVVLAFAAGVTSAAADKVLRRTEQLDSVVHGAPAKPTREWTLAAGGRIYDKWWEALDRKKPTHRNPSFPGNVKTDDANTWRCVACHGFDYKGKDGVNKSGDGANGVKGIRAAMRLDAKKIASLLRAAPHGYTVEMIKDDELARLAAFVRAGQHDTARFIDPATRKAKGSTARGAAVFQTTCAVCHGYDGRLLNWGTKEEPAYIGTEAKALPEEVLHKIRNAHPGAAMINLRAMSMQDAVNVLTYAQTLPEK
jgi:thiosulfate dehydrogenase